MLAAATSVGQALRLPGDWLNDRAKAFASEVTSGATVWKGNAVEVSVAAPEQLLAMTRSALRDDVDYEDAAVILRHLAGEKEQIWSLIRPYLVPGMEAWKKTNFDIPWEDTRGPAELVRALTRATSWLREWARGAHRRPGELTSLDLPQEMSTTEQALAAGVVEMLALRWKVTPPGWVESVGPAPEEVWLTRHGRRLPQLRERCRQFGPEPLRRRRVFALPEFLATA